MFALDKGSENSALGELIAKRTHFAHSQVRQEVLYFENVIKQLGFGKAQRAVLFVFAFLVLLHFLNESRLTQNFL